MKNFLFFSIVAMFGIASTTAQNEQGSAFLMGQTTNFNFAYQSEHTSVR
jgi:hypothetical protein